MGVGLGGHADFSWRALSALWMVSAAPPASWLPGVVDDDEWPGFSPTCERCLVQLQPSWNPPTPPVWRCPDCGLVRVF